MGISRFLPGFIMPISACLCASLANAQESVHNTDKYSIIIDLDKGSIDVEAFLYQIDKREIICEPAFGQRYGEQLSQVRMTTSDGREPVRKNAVAQNKSSSHTTSFIPGCHTGIHDDLVVKYTLSQAKLNNYNYWVASNLSPIRNDQIFAIPGVSLFMERNALQSTKKQHKTDIEIQIKGQIVSSLSPIEQSDSAEVIIQNKPGQSLYAKTDPHLRTQSFAANNSFELTRSYWAFGSFKVMAAASDKVSWQVAYFPDEYPNASIIQREISQILDYYTALMPLKTPKHLAVFLFSAPFDNNYHHGFARPGGIILQMGKKAASQNDTRRILIAHELFHQYNGENLRYDPDKYEETAWIREGMTQFIAFKTLLTLGLISWNQLYDWMAYSIQKQTTAYDAYHHGFFISQAIEQQWTIYQTGYSLDKFWQWMHDKDAVQNQWATVFYANNDIQNLLMQYSAFDFSQFFKKYVPPKSKLPIDDLLKLAGLCKYSVQEVTHSIGIDYQLDPQNAFLRIKSIDPQGSAAQAGIKKDDIIIPEPNIDWTDQTDKKLTVLRKGSKLQFKIPVVTEIRNKLAIRPCR